MRNVVEKFLVSRLCSCVLLSLLAGLVGCGGGGAGLTDETLIPVSGVVTLDGAPLEGAEIVFEPQGAGGMSFASTNAKGEYSLLYNQQQNGAVAGEHVVRIRKIGGPDTNFDTLNMLPEKYGEKSTLTATVGADSKTHNFDLTSK